MNDGNEQLEQTIDNTSAPQEAVDDRAAKLKTKKRKGMFLSLVSVALFAVAAGAGFLLFKSLEEKVDDSDPTGKIDDGGDVIVKAPGLTVVPTMLDTLSSDSTWCGTFQLVWNDMKNELVGGDVVFNPQLPMVENLNKETFAVSMLSDSYYYKRWGKKTLELKAEIERGIKDKFNEKSDVLDLIDWSEGALDDSDNLGVDRYLFYVMLKRKFEYPKEFTKLSVGEFNGKANVKYFGIDGTTKEEVKDQVEVLWYNSENDFAFVVGTKTDDELVFIKSPEGNTFDAIYKNIGKKAGSFAGARRLDEVDRLKIPNLDFDELRQYDELAGQPFQTKIGTGTIMAAIQTIRFSLDEKGGEVKSEAVIDVKDEAVAMPETPRYFYLDGTFALFIREKGKSQPYFAARVDDIEKFQSK